MIICDPRPRVHGPLRGVALGAATVALFAAAPAAHAVSFLTSPAVASTIALPERTGTAQLYQEAFDPATGLLYVADVGNQKVNVVYTAAATRAGTGSKYVITGRDGSKTDPAAGTIVKRINVAGSVVYGLGIDPSTHKVYGTASVDNKIVIIQGNDGTGTASAGELLKTATVTGTIREVVVNPADHKVYVDQTGETTVAELSGETGRILRTFDASGGLPGVATTAGLEANFEAGVLYAANLDRANPSGSISVIDIATGAVVQNIAAGGKGTTSVAYDGSRNRLFVTNQGATGASGELGSVSTFDVDDDGADEGQLTLVKNVPTTQGALGAAVDEVNGLVYSTDYGATDASTPGTVTVLDADTGSKLTQVTVGAKPLFTVVDPVTHAAYVTNQADATISVINGSPAPKPSSADASTVTVAPASATAGQSVTLSGTGFSAGQPVSAKFDDAGASALASTTALPDGSFTLSVTVPADAKGGPRHWFRVLGTAGTPAGAPARSKVAAIAITPATATVTSTIKQPIRTDEYKVYQEAYNPRTGLLYVADPGAGRVRVIYTAQATRNSTGGRYVVTPRGGGKATDPAVNAVVKSIDTSDHPAYGLAINTKTGVLYGSTPEPDGSFNVINTFTDTVTKVLQLGENGGAREVRVDEATNKVYALQTYVNTIAEIDGDTNTVARTFNVADGASPTFNYPAGLAINTDKGLLYTGSLDIADFGKAPVNGSVTVVDIASGKTVQTVAGGGPFTTSLAYDGGTNQLFVANQGQDALEGVNAQVVGSVSVYALDPATGRITSLKKTTTTAPGALGIVIDAPRGVVYSTDFGYVTPGAHTVSVLSPETGEKIGSIDVGLKPLHAQVDPETGTLYVSNQFDASVSVVTPGRLAPAPQAPQSGNAVTPTPAPAAVTPAPAPKPAAAAPVKLTARTTLSAKRLKVGRTLTLRVKLSAAGVTATGKVTVKVDGRTKGSKTVTIKQGTAKVSLKGLKAGKHKVSWAYAGSATTKAAKGSATVTVVR